MSEATHPPTNNQDDTETPRTAGIAVPQAEPPCGDAEATDCPGPDDSGNCPDDLQECEVLGYATEVDCPDADDDSRPAWSNQYAIDLLTSRDENWEEDVRAALANSQSAINSLYERIEELTSDVEPEEALEADAEDFWPSVYVDLPTPDPTTRQLINRLQIIGCEYTEHLQVQRILNGPDEEHEDGTVGPPRLWEVVDSMAKQSAVDKGAKTRPFGVSVHTLRLVGGGELSISLRFQHLAEVHMWANNGYEVGDLFVWDRDNVWYTAAAGVTDDD